MAAQAMAVVEAEMEVKAVMAENMAHLWFLYVM